MLEICSVRYYFLLCQGCCCGPDRMVVGFTTTYAIIAIHH